MGERSVHEAAKRTVAEVLCWGHHRDDWTGRTRVLCDEHLAEANAVLAALVASAEVRTALAALAGTENQPSKEGDA